MILLSCFRYFLGDKNYSSYTFNLSRSSFYHSNIMYIFILIFCCFTSTTLSVSAEWQFYRMYDKDYDQQPDTRYGHCMVSIVTTLLPNNTYDPISSTSSFSPSSSSSSSSSSSNSDTPNDDYRIYNNTFWIFGGYNDSRIYHTSILLIYDIEGNYQEINIKQNNNVPLPRIGHTCVQLDKSNILIYGGQDSNLNILGDLWSFNISNSKWKLLSSWYTTPNLVNSTIPILLSNNSTSNDTSNNSTNSTNSTNINIPIPRQRHSSASNSSYLFLFGGKSSKSVLGDFWIYNVLNETWTMISNSTYLSNGQFLPQPRWKHTSVFSRNKFWVFGGENAQGTALSDLWMYDVTEMKWSLASSGGSNLARSGHLMEVDRKTDRGFMVYGGYKGGGVVHDSWIYEFDSSVWNQLDVFSAYDVPSASSSTSLVYSSDYNSFVSFGSSTDNNGIWLYDLDCYCNNKGGCYFGLCNCFSGYFGDNCEYSIDGPIFLGLGIAISVPILCFGWCVLRCTPLPTRIKVLTCLLIISSSSLFISVRSCLACWLPISITGLLSSLIGTFGIFKRKNPDVLFIYIIGVFISIGCSIYGLGSFLPSCMLGTCRNDSESSSWLPKFAIIMDFIEGSLLILVLPLCIKLYRLRKLVYNLNNNTTMNNNLFSTEMTGLSPLVKKMKSSIFNDNNNNNNNESDQNQKALNYLQKEHNLRQELNRIRLLKLTEVIRIEINRENVYEESFKQLSDFTTTQMMQNVHVKFVGEEGIDMGGLRKEWFSLLFKKVFDQSHGLFILNPNYTLSINPRSQELTDHLAMFYFVGRMVAKSVIEGFQIDHTFSRTIYKMVLGKAMSLDDLAFVDAQFHQSLVWVLENSVDEIEELTFSTTTMVVDPTTGNLVPTLVDLIPQGRDVFVNNENKQEFVKLLSDWRFKRDITDQAYHFVLGFRELIPLDLVKDFNECELELFICGLVEIDVVDWKANTIYRGYNPTSTVIEWFWSIVEEMEMEDRIRLLQFITGNARLPPAGFQALISFEGHSKFQIHKSYSPDNQLPIARTCFNRLDLPNYDSIDNLKKALYIAIREGLGFGIA